MAKEYKSLAALVQAVRNGEVPEEQLRVVMDNDCSQVYLGDDEEAEPIYRGNGYYDTEDLWPLVFPKATVEWC